MVRIDVRVARALSSLKEPAFAPLLEYWRAKRQDALEQLAVCQNELQMYRLQGEAETYKTLVENVESAQALIAKLQK